MENKKYLKWYQKVAYGSGDMAANCTYALITSFLLLYLTNTVGLNPGVVGTLMMLSKLLDGITDILFGAIMDRTKSRMGKARPWMLYSQIGLSLCLFLIFAIPDMGENMQYAYFFVFYTALNAVFFTASNISYSSLTALITKNPNERIQLGSIRFMFAIFANLVIAFFTMQLVEGFGGGAQGWRSVALLFAVIGLVVNTFSVLMVKELPNDLENLSADETEVNKSQKIGLLESIKLLLKNKYYVIILAVYIIYYGTSGIVSGVGIYFMSYYMKDQNLFGTFSLFGLLPMIIGLAITPMLVKKIGSMYRLNLWGFISSVVFSILFIVAALSKNLPFMFVTVFLKGIGQAPMIATLNALIAEVSGYTQRTQKISLEGTVYSCSSLGIKLGGGIGVAVAGGLLNFSAFNGMAAVQTPGAINMIFIMYAVIPAILTVILTFLLSLLKVEKANKEWDAEHAEGI